MRSTRLLFVFLACLGLAALLLAGCTTRGLTIEDTWARPGVQGGNSAVYFVLQNDSQEADALTQAASPTAGMVQIHRSSVDDSGTMHMEQQPQVDIPAGQEVRFEPGGLHVMLMNLQSDLQPGDTIDVTLTFENFGVQTLQVPVKEP